MDEKDTNIISMTSKHAQHCVSCSKLISLIERETYMCSKCKVYFCTECYPLFVNADKCPGSFQQEHEPIMVRITRTVKEYAPLGVSIDQIERSKTSESKIPSSLKIMPDSDSKTNEKTNPSKPKLKILDD